LAVTPSPAVHHGQEELRFAIVQRRRALEPVGGARRFGCDTVAAQVHRAEIEHGARQVLRGGGLEQGARTGVVLRHAATLEVQRAEIVLGGGIAAVGATFELRGGARIVTPRIGLGAAVRVHADARRQRQHSEADQSLRPHQ
jgi:hypothetical protein